MYEAKAVADAEHCASLRQITASKAVPRELKKIQCCLCWPGSWIRWNQDLQQLKSCYGVKPGRRSCIFLDFVMRHNCSHQWDSSSLDVFAFEGTAACHG